MNRVMKGFGCLAVCLMTKAALADDRPIAIEIRVLQIAADESGHDADLAALTSTGIDVFYKGELPKGFSPLPEPPKVDLRIETEQSDGSFTRFDTDAMGLAYVANNGKITLAGKSFQLDGTNTQPGSPFFCIAAPRVAMNSGQQAEIIMGRNLQYLQPAEKGMYRAVEAPDAFEGLKVKSTASRTEQGDIQIDELTLSLSEVQSRERLPELGLDVGLPRMRTSTVSISHMQIPDRMVAMIPFHDASEKPQVQLVVLIHTTDMPVPSNEKSE